MTETRRDVIEVLTHDHREVESVFVELEGLRGQTGEAAKSRRKELVDQVVIELVRHSVAEETQVYPKVQEKVSAEEAERAKHEHGEAEETMKALDGMDPDDPAFDRHLETLMREIREHVAEEEGQMFPHMRTVFSEDELVDMAQQVERVKTVAPTRPHPSVPHEKGARLATGPVAGLFDRMRDAVTGRGQG
ncbi:hemerythrin domain-containing protein [Geodermatophilus sp. SYSU D00758]